MDAPAAPVRSRGARWAPRRSHRVVALDDASLYYATGSLDPALLEAKYRRIDNASWAGFQAPCYAPV